MPCSPRYKPSEAVPFEQPVELLSRHGRLPKGFKTHISPLEDWGRCDTFDCIVDVPGARIYRTVEVPWEKLRLI